jgi:ATP-dependent protease Clp ATPase subunit
MEDGDLSFTPEALQEIAKLARRRGTGARGLRSVIEDLMRDIIFEAGGTKLKGLHVVVDEQRVHALSDENSSSDNLIIEETNEDDDEDQAPASPQPDIDDEPAGETAARLIS